MLLADSSADNAAAVGVFGFIAVIYLLILIGAVVVIAIPHYYIVKKAGYNGWMSLLYFIPFVGLVMMYVFAFSEWPVRRGMQPDGFAPPPPYPPPFPPPDSFGGGGYDPNAYAPQTTYPTPPSGYPSPQAPNPYAPPPSFGTLSNPETPPEQPPAPPSPWSA